jgi:hypothetical protein
MLDTGFPRADVENEFLRARRHQALAALAYRLRRQPPGGDRLLPLDEVTRALGWRGERQRRASPRVNRGRDRPGRHRRLRDRDTHRPGRGEA